MRNVTILIVLLFALSSCNAPLDQRNGQQVFDNASTSTSTNANDNTSTVSNPVGSVNTGNGGVTTLGPGFEGCVIDTQFYVSGNSGQIGPLGLCQNNVNLKSFLLKFDNASFSMNDATCFIPTSKDPSGASVPLGMAQCTMHNQGDTKQAYLATNSNTKITGVMVMKYSSVNSFFGCMQTYQQVYPVKYQQYMQSCGLSPQVCQNNAAQQADQAAKAEQSYICSNFKQNHSYIDVTLPPIF